MLLQMQRPSPPLLLLLLPKLLLLYCSGCDSGISAAALQADRIHAP